MDIWCRNPTKDELGKSPDWETDHQPTESSLWMRKRTTEARTEVGPGDIKRPGARSVSRSRVMFVREERVGGPASDLKTQADSHRADLSSLDAAVVSGPCPPSPFPATGHTAQASPSDPVCHRRTPTTVRHDEPSPSSPHSTHPSYLKQPLARPSPSLHYPRNQHGSEPRTSHISSFVGLAGAQCPAALFQIAIRNRIAGRRNTDENAMKNLRQPSAVGSRKEDVPAQATGKAAVLAAARTALGEVTAGNVPRKVSSYAVHFHIPS
jgi:hypothetical protein